MHNHTAISRSDAVAKFGHYFVLESDKNRFGYKIVEKLGQSCSIFDDEDDNMDFDEACGSLLGRVLIESRRKTIDNKIFKESFSRKIDLFFYKHGWMKAEKMAKIKRFLEKDDLAHQNLEIAQKNIEESIDFKSLLVSLPETMYLPKHYFEVDKVYYQFKHSHSIHQNSELIEVKPSSIEISLDDDNNISMSTSFMTMDGVEVDGRVANWDLKSFNDDSYNKPYLGTGYSNIFLFLDKESCKQFAVDKIKNDIEHFKKSLDALS
jgi:hypothetical protein